MALIVDLMTDMERVDLFRAIDDFRRSRTLPDDLDPLWRALMRRAEQELDGGSGKVD
jgi:hypothetical protein